MDKAMDESVRRVSELLKTHADRQIELSETIDGLVTVTVNSQLHLIRVTLHDESIDAKRRAELESAIVKAVNGARTKAVKAASESLGKLQESEAWKDAMDHVFKRAGPSKKATRD